MTWCKKYNEPGPSEPIQVGGIRVTVNAAWINSLPKDAQGNVTFFVKVSE